jgi:hypothetical protein
MRFDVEIHDPAIVGGISLSKTIVSIAAIVYKRHDGLFFMCVADISNNTTTPTETQTSTKNRYYRSANSLP